MQIQHNMLTELLSLPWNVKLQMFKLKYNLREPYNTLTHLYIIVYTFKHSETKKKNSLQL